MQPFIITNHQNRYKSANLVWKTSSLKVTAFQRILSAPSGEMGADLKCLLSLLTWWTFLIKRKNLYPCS